MTEINYKLIKFQRSTMFKQLTEALDITREWIKKREFILIGGQSIDYAMRIKGEKLYNDEDIPDYDFYSPNHYKDAQELATILCNKNLPNVSLIFAMHVTTIRVRVDFETVADISYCPQKIYDKIHTLDYKGIRLIHPNTQMIDQHRALSYPYDNINMGGTIFRWDKDLNRHELLYELYPIKKSGSDTVYNKMKIKDVNGFFPKESFAFCGYSAYDLHMGNVNMKSTTTFYSINNMQIITDNFDTIVSWYMKLLS